MGGLRCAGGAGDPIVGAGGSRAGRRGGRRRGDGGETLALLVLWPALITLILLLLVHAFIVTNARSEADAAASAGLRAAWRVSADADFLKDPNSPAGTYAAYVLAVPHPDVSAMVEAARDAVARTAGSAEGWRWWTPGVAVVHSDWCSADYRLPSDAPRSGDRPVGGESGWVRVVVSGEVFGPLAALWPNRLDRVYAIATGPAVLNPPAPQPGTQIDLSQAQTVPVELPTC